MGKDNTRRPLMHYLATWGGFGLIGLGIFVGVENRKEVIITIHGEGICLELSRFLPEKRICNKHTLQSYVYIIVGTLGCSIPHPTPPDGVIGASTIVSTRVLTSDLCGDKTH